MHNVRNAIVYPCLTFRITRIKDASCVKRNAALSPKQYAKE